MKTAIAALLLATTCATASAQQVYFDPTDARLAIPPGGTFPVTLVVANVPTTAFSVSLSVDFDPAILSLTDSDGTHLQGSFCRAAGEFFSGATASVTNQETRPGHYVLAATGSHPDFSGTGRLVKLNFRVVGIGTTALTIGPADGESVAYVADSQTRTSLLVTNGTVTNRVADLIAQALTAPASVHVGAIVPVSVNVTNRGLVASAASSVEFRIGSTLLGTLPLPALAADASTTLSLSWDSSDATEEPGLLTLSATVLPIAEEGTQVENNVVSVAVDMKAPLDNVAPVVTDAAQWTWGGEAVPAGRALLPGPGFRFAALSNDADGDAARIEVELLPVGVAFSDVATHVGGWSVPGASSTATAAWVAEGSWHWQYRLTDRWGQATSWVSFGGNDEDAADFTTIPEGSTGPGGCINSATGGVSAIALIAILALLPKRAISARP